MVFFFLSVLFNIWPNCKNLGESIQVEVISVESEALLLWEINMLEGEGERRGDWRLIEKWNESLFKYLCTLCAQHDIKWSQKKGYDIIFPVPSLTDDISRVSSDTPVTEHLDFRLMKLWNEIMKMFASKVTLFTYPFVHFMPPSLLVISKYQERTKNLFLKHVGSDAEIGSFESFHYLNTIALKLPLAFLSFVLVLMK